MHVFIVGGNGRTGAYAITELLSRGHTVTALVRNPASLPTQSGLTIHKGTPLNPEDIAAAFTTHRPDAIIVTLNAPRASESPFAAPVGPANLLADSTRNLLTAMETFGVKRIIIMSAWGVGASFAQLNVLMRLTIRWTNMAAQFQDHEAVEQLVKQARGLDWTLVKPVMLKGEGKHDVREWGELGQGAGFMPSISRESVAGFLVDVLEGGDKWNGKTPVISN